MYYQLVPSTHPTEGIGFGLLPEENLIPTVTANAWKGARNLNEDGANVSQSGQKYGIRIEQLAKAGLLPTPLSVQRDHPERVTALRATGAESIHSRKNGGQRPNSILDAMMFKGLITTPTAQASRGNTSDKRGKGNLTDQIAEMELTTGKTSQLNPLFVMEMMGFPPDWTALPFLSGGTKA